MTTINLIGQEHASAHDALVELNFSGDHAVLIGNRYFTITDGELRRLQDAGVQPPTLHHNEWSQRIISVPGNL